ncbi:hypothetical protein EZV73_06065 [Acidaminobacter sp. JC074]|uniref:S8 family serine peptidase n=1 Tax=Acidaminobacter sp. JC074 TaxID=2530199 RepID=UPI001F10D330|nr:S8 family serine peptidase [Acidaminobacter sp. JC074]MCH4887125.1 hypothetical protein [Acidaminobacter sp. JC074]
MIMKQLRRFLVFTLILSLVMSNFVFADNETVVITDDVRELMYGEKSKISENLVDLDLSSDDQVRIVIELEEEPVIKHATAQGVKVADMQQSQIDSIVSAIAEERNETLNEMSSESIEVTVLNTYENVFNGFSMTAKYGDIEKIAKLSNVKRVSISKEYALPEPQMTSSYTYTKADIVNKQYKYTGEGMVVSIIDSGVDYTHKDMKVDADTQVALSENEIIGIISTDKLPGKYYTEKVPYGYNYMDRTDVIIDYQADTDMHGMHVAGTVAANGEIKGVAPNAQLLAMKVFSNDPAIATTYGDIMVAAMDDSVKLGADVMNLSIGATAQWVDHNDPEQVAVRNATEAGIVMSISAGNSAFYGNGNDNPLAKNPDIGVVGSPGLSVESIQVASSDNYSELYELNVDADGLSTLNGYGADRWEDKTYDLATIGGKVGNPEDFEGVDVKGKVVLVKRGALSFYDKTVNALNAGAAGIIVYDHGLAGFYYNQGNWAEIPFMMMPKEDGEALEAAIAGGLDEFTVSLGYAQTNPTSGYISSFSSWGSTPNLDFKPELTAPGGDIYSTLNDDKYGKKSGTSMAAPHVAGGATLIAERIKEESIFPAEVRTTKDGARSLLVKNILMNTALPIVDTDNYGGESYQSVRQQGAGNMNLLYGVKTTAVVTDSTSGVAKVNLGEVAEGSTIDFTLRVKNYGNAELKYNVSAMAQINTNYVDKAGNNRNALTTEEIKGIKTTITVGQEELDGLLTVPAEGEVLVNFEMDLEEATMYDGSDIMKAFPNGNYIEGFAFFDLHEESLSTGKADAKTAYDAANAELTKLAEELATLEKTAEAKAEAITELETAIETLNADIETLKTDNADTITLASSYDTAKEAYETAQAAYDELVAKHDGLDGKTKEEIEASKTTAEAELVVLQAELKALTDAVEGLNTAKSEADAELATATQAVTDAEKVLEDANALEDTDATKADKVAAATTALEDANEAKAEKQTAADDAQADIDKNTADTSAKNEEIAAKEEVIETLAGQLTIVEDVVAAKEAVDAAKVAMDNAKANLTPEVEAAYTAYEAAKSQKLAEIAEKEAALVAARNAKDEADEKVEEKTPAYQAQVKLVADKKEAYDNAVEEYNMALPLSVPFLGFYGDFGDAPAIDAPFHSDDSFYGLTGLLDKDYNFLGQRGSEKSDDLIAISPNGDGYNDFATPILSFLRNMKEISYTIENEAGDTVRTLGMNDIQSKDYFDGKNGRQYSILSQYNFDGTAGVKVDEEGNTVAKVLPDGQYTYVITGKLDDAEKTVKRYEIPVKVDTTKPVIKSVSHDKKAQTVTFDITENGSGAQVFVLLNSKYELVAKSYTNTIDVSEVEAGTIVIPVVSDMAANEAIGSPLLLNDTQKPEVTLNVDALEVYTDSDLTFTGTVIDFLMPTLTINDTPVEVAKDGSFKYKHVYKADGLQSLHVVATDDDGNEIEFTRDFYIDSAAPVMVVTPTGFDTTDTVEYVASTVEKVSFTAKIDEATFPTLKVKYNGDVVYDVSEDFVSYKELMQASEYEFTKEVTLVEGDNIIQILAEDVGGNVAKFEKKIVKLAEGEQAPTNFEVTEATVTTPDNGVSFDRALDYSFTANKAGTWSIDIIGSDDAVIKTLTHDSATTVTGKWHPEADVVLGGEFTIKATVTSGEETAVKEEVFTVNNYKIDIVKVGHQIVDGMLRVTADIANLNTGDENGTVIIQLSKENGLTFSINTLDFNLGDEETTVVTTGVQAPDEDVKVEVFVWTSWSTPAVMAEKDGLTITMD